MPSGTVERIGTSRAGKPTVTIGGQIYSASRSEPPVATLQQGDKIEFDSASSVFNGATVWFLNTWKLLEGVQKYPQPSPAPTNGTSPVPAQGLTEGERAFASNVVAHAISAGVIKNPNEITAWVVACKDALREQFEMDDKIPF